MSFALATSAAEPVQRFDTAAELARAILARPGSHDTHVLRAGACWPEGETHLAIHVYGIGERTGFLGYAIGFAHDFRALREVLDEAKAELAA